MELHIKVECSCELSAEVHCAHQRVTHIVAQEVYRKGHDSSFNLIMHLQQYSHIGHAHSLYTVYEVSFTCPVTWAGLSVAVLVLHRGSHTGTGVDPALRRRAAAFAGSKASGALLGTTGPRFPGSPSRTLWLR